MGLRQATTALGTTSSAQFVGGAGPWATTALSARTGGDRLGAN